MEALAPTAWGFLLVVFRTAGLVTTAPLFSMRSTPAPIRISLSFAVGFTVFSGAGFPRAALPAHLGALAGVVLAETLVGVLAGLAATFALESAGVAGQLAAQSMGLSYGSILDPLNGAQSTTIGQLFGVMGLSSALALGLPREAISWLARSVVEVPPGSIEGVSELARGTVLSAINAIAVGVRLGFPFLAAVTLGHLVLGLLNRAAQQLHISNLGFSVTILFGGGALWAATPAMLQACGHAVVAAFP